MGQLDPEIRGQGFLGGMCVCWGSGGVFLLQQGRSFEMAQQVLSYWLGMLNQKMLLGWPALAMHTMEVADGRKPLSVRSGGQKPGLQNPQVCHPGRETHEYSPWQKGRA